MGNPQPESNKLGRFDLGDKIAAGGMATVYFARVDAADDLAGQDLAIKILHEHLSDDGDFVRMFRDEGRIAMRFAHPNVVKVHEVGVQSGRYYIAMERVDGWNLAQILQAWRAGKKRLPKAAGYEVLRQCLTALIYVHNFKGDDGKRLNIVHRDISPHNILVSRAPMVKVTDFGIARGQHRSDRTRTGTVKGKMHYMAPEQAAGKRVTARADLYALGAVAYECFTGKPLFGPGRTEVLQERAIRGEIDFGGAFAALHVELQEWLRKCLAIDPNERFQSAEAMLAAMENIKGAHASRFKTDVLMRLLDPPAPRSSLQEQALFADEEMRPTGPLSLPVPAAQQRASSSGPQRPISGTFCGANSVSGVHQSPPSERLQANAGPPVDWTSSQFDHVRPSSSALYVVRAAGGDSALRRVSRRHGRSRDEVSRELKQTGSHIIDHDDGAVKRSTAIALRAAGVDVEVPTPQVPAPGSRPSKREEPAAPSAARLQSRVVVERQQGLAFAGLVAWTCTALLLFATLLEVWNARVELPRVDEATFSSLFASMASDDAPRVAFQAAETEADEPGEPPPAPVASAPALAPPPRNDVFLPRSSGGARAGGAPSHARRDRSKKVNRPKDVGSVAADH